MPSPAVMRRPRVGCDAQVLAPGVTEGDGRPAQMPEHVVHREPAAGRRARRGLARPGRAAVNSGPGEGVFGPVVPVLDDAPLLDRVIGLSGRDPGWKP